MHRSLDRDALEQRAIAAQSLYIAALAHAERIHYDIERAMPSVTEHDLLVARSDLDRRFDALRDLLDALGYVPRGFTARLPPEPGAPLPGRSRAYRTWRHA